MKRFILMAGVLTAAVFPGSDAGAANGAVNLRFSGSAVWLRVDGDKDDDWWMETSTNCDH